MSNVAPQLAGPPTPDSGPQSRTLEFENARNLQTLFANDNRMLKEMERALRLKIVTRDGWVRFEGAPSDLDAAVRVFHDLERVREKGGTIGTHEFRVALASQTGPAPRAEDLVEARIHCSPRRAAIVPRTAGQLEYVRQINKHDLVFGIGPAGTGKTYLAVACAVAALKRGDAHRIILTRPAVEAGEALGFLPGNLQEKIFPYLRPLYDALHDMLDADEIQKQIERGVIEIAPLAYMRGRTLSHSFVILDEAQNTTTEQMFMFLTRLGEGSKCVVTGDVTQIDLPPNKASGLIEARDALEPTPSIAFCQFDETDVVRHELVRAIINAYKAHRGQEPALARQQGKAQR